MRLSSCIIRFFLLSLIATSLVACKPSLLREARATVAQADSMYACGSHYLDSASLARSWKTLARLQQFYPTDFMKASFHYGLLFVNHNDPVSAMQYFIYATHVRTKDYTSKARVYSQMGAICGNAEDYQLMGDMYAHAAHDFWKAQDTLHYCKCLQKQAFTIAGQGNTESALGLLKEIEIFTDDAGSRHQLLLVRSQVFLQTKQLDSSVCYLKEYALFNVLDSAQRVEILETFSLFESLLSLYHTSKEGKSEVTWDDLLGLLMGQQ